MSKLNGTTQGGREQAITEGLLKEAARQKVVSINVHFRSKQPGRICYTHYADFKSELENSDHVGKIWGSFHS